MSSKMYDVAHAFQVLLVALVSLFLQITLVLNFSHSLHVLPVLHESLIQHDLILISGLSCLTCL